MAFMRDGKRCGNQRDHQNDSGHGKHVAAVFDERDDRPEYDEGRESNPPAAPFRECEKCRGRYVEDAYHEIEPRRKFPAFISVAQPAGSGYVDDAGDAEDRPYRPDDEIWIGDSVHRRRAP